MDNRPGQPADDPDSFREALERALGDKSQVEIARSAGVGQSTLSTWLSGGGARPSQVFAVERALGVEPGHLSSHLGYVPVGASPPTSVPFAIDADPRLDEDAKATMLYAYRYCVKVSRQSIVDADVAAANASLDQVDELLEAATEPPANGDPDTRRSA